MFSSLYIFLEQDSSDNEAIYIQQDAWLGTDPARHLTLLFLKCLFL